MKRVIAKLISIVLLINMLFLSPSCVGSNKHSALPEGKTANYLAHTGMLGCGEYFLVLSDDGHLRLFGPSGEKSVDKNAVEALEQKQVHLIGTDDRSFYFAEQLGSERYGKGTGRRVYRYFPESAKTVLVSRSTSVSNTDGLLGLDDVFSIAPLMTKHPNYGEVYYALDENRAIVGYEMAEVLLRAAKSQNKGLKLPETDFRFAISEERIFFADALNALYEYDCETQGITRLDYASVSAFFVTDERLFVLAGGSAALDVLDLRGNRIAEIDLDGRSVVSGIMLDGEDIYFISDGFELMRITSDMKLYSTGFSSMDNRICVKDGVIYAFITGTVSAVSAGDGD